MSDPKIAAFRRTHAENAAALLSLGEPERAAESERFAGMTDAEILDHLAGEVRRVMKHARTVTASTVMRITGPASTVAAFHALSPAERCTLIERGFRAGTVSPEPAAT